MKIVESESYTTSLNYREMRLCNVLAKKKKKTTNQYDNCFHPQVQEQILIIIITISIHLYFSKEKYEWEMELSFGFSLSNIDKL